MFRERAAVGHSQHAEVFPLKIGIVPPFERRVEYDSFSVPFTGAVGAENAGVMNACVKPLCDKKIPAVERSSPERHYDFTFGRRRIGHFGVFEGVVQGIEDEGFQWNGVLMRAR